MAGLTTLVEPPVREKRVGGLSGVATYRSNDRLAHSEGLVYQSEGCVFPNTELSRCLADAPVADKTFDSIPTADGIGEPVTLYAGITCHIAPEPDELERARQALEAGKDRVLEGMLADWADGGTAVTAGKDAKTAVARIDHELDKSYVGRGVILMSRYDADLAGLEDADDGDAYLRTKSGTPVVASGWVEPGTVYGLGAVVVEHGEVVERETVDPLKNTHWALAEQVHALIVDCEFRIKSTITA